MEQAERLRPHPTDRFAAPTLLYALPEVASQLLAEPQAGEAGHRQETLYRGHGVTVALFVFGRFSRLPEHRAQGLVTVHVLRGRLKMTVDGQVHDLTAGRLLVLAPGVPHSVAAEEESEMLLSVHLPPPQPRPA